MAEQELCKVSVQADYRGYTFRECGRPIKEDGMCGPHLAGKKRSAAHSKRWAAERKAEDDLAKSLEEVRERFANLTGEPATLHMQNYKYTGHLVVSPEALKKLMDNAY